MNALPGISPPSTINRAAEKRVLILAYIAAFGLHALLFSWIQVPFPVGPAKQYSGFQLALVSPRTPTLGESRHEPALLAYPSSQGFSQTALAQTISSPAVPPGYQDRGDFLPNPANPQSTSLADKASISPRVGLDQFLPQPQEEPLLRATSPEPGSTARWTALGVERIRLGGAPLPLLENAPLRPTVVRCSVNPAGTVTAVLLDQSSGSEAADRLALRETAGWLFHARQDAAEGDLDWLRITIQWDTQPKARK
jgi:TonB family protein